VRSTAAGQLLCEPCSAAWQSYQQPFVAAPASGPNPWVAGSLGVIPGVGAMYNGQFLKGFIHVIVFAVLISITEYHGIFGLFIAAWIVYQSFEAFHTAKALHDGQPAPDPLGLNEMGNWMNMGRRTQNPGQPSAGPATAGFQSPPAGQYQAPFAPPSAPYAAPSQPPTIPWRRREPVGAIVLIALGSLFLLGQLDIFHGHFMEYAWPLMLIALGVWLFVRRIGDSQGGSR